MIGQTEALLHMLIEERMPTSPLSRSLRFAADVGALRCLRPHEREWLNDAADWIEERMAKKPTPVRKGIPIGSYEEIADKAGKIRLKKKPYRMTLNQQYVSKNRKRYKAAK